MMTETSSSGRTLGVPLLPAAPFPFLIADLQGQVDSLVWLSIRLFVLLCFISEMMAYLKQW